MYQYSSRVIRDRMRGTGASWSSALGYLLVSLLLLGTIGDANRDENPDFFVYDYSDPPNDPTPNEIDELNRTLIDCCNKTRIDVLSNVQNLSKTITTKIEGLANKDDVINLQNELDELATKSAVTILQGKLDNLPTMDTIRNYTEHINDKFTTLVKKLETNVTELGDSAKNLISDKTNGLSIKLEDIKTITIGGLETKIQKDTDQLLKKLNTLSITFEDIQNRTEIFGELATKEGLNATKHKLTVSIHEVQGNVNDLKQHLTKLVNKDDIENITNLVESLATKESLETFQDKLHSLSKEGTVKNLTDFVSSQIADKTDVDKTKASITASTSEIKMELSALKDKLSDLAANTDLQSLNTKVLRIDENINTSRETVSDLKEMLQNLKKKQEEQNNILQKLAANVGKPSTSQELKNVEKLIKSLQTTSTNTLHAVKNITNTGQSTTNCLDSSEFSKKISSLKNKVDNKCSIDGMNNDLEGMEERIHKRLENITLCDEKKDSPITTIPEATTCEDTVFLNPPYGLDVCYAVVTKRLCDTDPLIGFHCCNSCVFANQITSNGPHRYVNAPRKVNYSAVLSAILSDKNY